MYPLLLKSKTTDYIWGGDRLKREFGIESESQRVAEAWVLSLHKNGQNTVLNGQYKGKALSDVLKMWGKEALGKNAEAFDRFPILIKLIDAKDKLSVQVHPEDGYALEHEGEYGKTEMWYIVDCDNGASIIFGLDRNLSREEFEKHVIEGRVLEVCRRVPVKNGDCFFIEAGTLHAIGEGILIAEVQQNSDTTYRVSDYGRLGADGKPRELHIDKAVEVTSLTVSADQTERPAEVYGFGSIRSLADCKYFKTELLSLSGEFVLSCPDSFSSVFVLEGSVQIKCKDEMLSVKKGDSLFIPAGLEVSISGKAELLITKV